MTDENTTAKRKMTKPTKAALYNLLKAVITDDGSVNLDGALYNDIVNTLNTAGVNVETEAETETAEDETILD